MHPPPEKRHTDADAEHHSRHADPAEADRIKRKPARERTERTEWDTSRIQRIDDTDKPRSGDGERIDIAVLLPEAVAQTQKDQHDGDRIDRVQDRDGNVENGAQTEVADQEGNTGNDKHPAPVGELAEEHRKIL